MEVEGLIIKEELLITSDLHIDDYKTNSPSPGFRLLQYLKLAERIVEVCKERKIKYVCILGDILNNPISAPRIVVVLQRFLKIITDAGLKVIWIAGQHDGDSRELNSTDTYMGVFTQELGVHYAHKKSITVNGCKIYFENYSRAKHIVPEQECDVYLSHVTLGFGVTIDDSKFKLGIFGDIHEIIDKGKLHSVGTPIQIHSHEPKEGVLGILTIENGQPSFSRILTDPSGTQFLTFDKEVRILNSEVKEVVNEDREILDLLSGNQDFLEKIKKVVEDHDLYDIHREVDISKIPTQVSLDFKIKKLYAKDFKSIKDFVLEFDRLGRITFISGRIGSGKTSILEMIFVALQGNRQIGSNYKRIAPDTKLLVGIVLEYRGLTFEIVRYEGATEFYINEKPLERVNKRTLEATIRQYLPFIEVIDDFYIRTYTHFFENDRVKLISSCFNLGVFDYFRDQGKALYDDYQRKFKRICDDQTYLKGQYKTTCSQIESVNLSLQNYTDIDINLESELLSKSEKVRKLLSSKATLEGGIETLKYQRGELKKQRYELSKIGLIYVKEQFEVHLKLKNISIEVRNLKREVESLESIIKVEPITCPSCSKVFIPNRSYDDLKISLEDKKKLYESKKEEFTTLNRKITLTEAECQKIINDYNKLEMIQQQINSMKTDIADKESTLEEVKIEISQYPSEEDLSRDRSLISAKKALIKSIDDLVSNKEKLVKKALEIKEEKVKLQTKIEKSELYVRLFDIKDLNSLPYTTLRMVSDYLSNDSIKFTTTRSLSSGEERLGISCLLKVGDHWVDYDRASHGQKTSLDLFILQRFLNLVGPVGILAFDESLSVIDPESYEETCQFISTFKANKMMITSHQLGFNYCDSRVHCNLDGDGWTEFSYE